jgi:Replication-relaxation
MMNERRPLTRPASFRLTSRDAEIIDFVFCRRRATADQIRRRFFGAGAASRMRHRLAMLFQERYLDRIQGRLVSQPGIYRLSARASRGLAVLRERYGDAKVRQLIAATGQDEHFVLITECYVLVWEALQTAGWRLAGWEDGIELRGRTNADGLVPDAHFSIELSDGSKAAFFLELERAAKSDQSMRRKLEQHRRFFRSGRYEEVFGSRSLRVLFVMVSSQTPRIDPAERLGHLAEQVGATFVCATTLNALQGARAFELLSSPLWRRAGRDGLYALFEGAPK